MLEQVKAIEGEIDLATFGREILQFLETYGKLDANWDSEYDEEGEK